MSTFDHTSLIQGINESLATFRKAQPDAMRGFAQLAQASMAEGALTSKHKELIALAIGVTQRCSGCIGFHVKALQKLGATRAELEEMLAVCVYMGGGPALMYTAEALTAMNVHEISRLHDRRGDIMPGVLDPPGQTPIPIVDMLFSQPILVREGDK